MDYAPGTILLGKYRVDELIGTGGMGNVVRASHLYLHQSVAIKIMLPEMSASASTVQRFLREAQATVKLKSEHIARVMDVGTAPDGAPFMVMEFLDGNDLNQILCHHGPQQAAIVVDLMLQACEGIAEAHALGIVHRDVKPSNFFITRRPDGSMLLKILDFGISKTPAGYNELTGTHTVIGTPTYMAPEQMKSGRSADPRSDIWSIGVVMYQLLTGRVPFAGETYAELVLKVGLDAPAPLLVPLPPGLGDVIMRCLEKDPLQRHQNVGELARMIAPYATDPMSSAQAAGRVRRILAQRGAQPGLLGSPLVSAGGLATPTPISPAQLTPRSWPPSQTSSVSHGAGQMTEGVRRGRAWLIVGVASLCLLAGAGGYALSQMSRASGAPRETALPSPPPAVSDLATTTAAGSGPAVDPSAAAAPSPAGTSAAPGAASGSAASSTAAAHPASTADGPTGKPPSDPPASAASTSPTASAATAKSAADEGGAGKSSVAATHSAHATTTKQVSDSKHGAGKPPARSKPDDLFDSRH